MNDKTEIRIPTGQIFRYLVINCPEYMVSIGKYWKYANKNMDNMENNMKYVENVGM